MSRYSGAAEETPLSTSLTDVLDHLREAYRLGEDRLPQDDLVRLHQTLARAGSRRSLSSDHTVVGVFGPTGSGKSSLVNALSGTAAARVAARRPTTSEPLALVWGSPGSAELLDWLGVGQRVELPDGAALVAGRAGAAATIPAVVPGNASAPEDDAASRDRSGNRVDAGDAAGAHTPGITGVHDGDARTAEARGDGGPIGRLRGLFRQRRRDRPRPHDEAVHAPEPGPAGPSVGLILLDLPDFDSTALAHREIVQRLAGQVDVLLWVVDPQKYADAALHHGFLRGLATHGAVTLVALNQADLLALHDREAVTASLRGILAAEGLSTVPVLPVSARTGDGLAALAATIRELAQGREASTRRLTADAERAAAELLPFQAGQPLALPDDAARHALGEELGVAAGVPLVVDAVRSAYRRDAHATMGWPVTRWLAGLRPDPLRRLNLRRADLVPEVHRSSLPQGQPAQQARVDHALRVFGDASAQQAVEPWQSAIRDAARSTTGELTDALDTAVSGVDLETGRRGWWWIFGVLQWVAFAALAGGLVWLAVVAGLGFLQLPAVDVPRVEGFPVPTLLILGGLMSGILLAVLAAMLARWGAARRAARVRRRLLAACSRVADDVVVRSVNDEVERANRFSASVRAASPRD